MKTEQSAVQTLINFAAHAGRQSSDQSQPEKPDREEYAGEAKQLPIDHDPGLGQRWHSCLPRPGTRRRRPIARGPDRLGSPAARLKGVANDSLIRSV